MRANSFPICPLNNESEWAELDAGGWGVVGGLSCGMIDAVEEKGKSREVCLCSYSSFMYRNGGEQLNYCQKAIQAENRQNK